MPAFEQQDIDLRERQSQYLDFLDDEVSIWRAGLRIDNFINFLNVYFAE